MNTDIRELTIYDRPSAIQLIAMSDLRQEGILEEGTRYWGAFDGEQLVGVIGCEYSNGYGLLRSAFVHPSYRGRGIAERLTNILMEEGKNKGLKALYLFTTTASGYWIKRGFQLSSVEELTANMEATPQIKLFDELGWLPTEVTYKYCL